MSRSHEQAGDDLSRRRPRILLVEDDVVVSLTLRAQLEAAGCAVVASARDADSAVQMACELRPDVVLMDIGLRDKDGVYATREIMARAPAPVIVVTAYGDDRVARALEAGACMVLTKPVLAEQLTRAIAGVISGAADSDRGEPGDGG